MCARRTTRELPRPARRAVGAVLVVLAAVLTVLSGRYGFHRDELYFLAAGVRPAWGYVDQPPLTPLLAHATTALFGATPAGLRVAATLGGLAAVTLAALLARELGAGRGGQVLTAAGVAGSTFVLVVVHMFSTTTVDLVVWLAVCLAAARLLRTADPRWWPAVGAAVGVGLLNKDLVLLLVAGLGVGVLVCGPRSVLRSAWLPVGAAVALLLVAPNLVWQARHGWPMLTVAAGIAADDGAANRLLFVPMQLVYLSPVLVPVWVVGLVRFRRDPALRRARAFGLAYPVVAVLDVALGGKPYYAVPLLVPALAAGAEPVLAWLRGRRLRIAAAGTAAAAGLAVSVVVALPVLPAGVLARSPVPMVNAEQAEQVGWPEFAAAVATAFDRIPPGDRARAVIFTANYGEAAALERYGPALGLPGAWSGHMSFGDWGPPERTGPVLLVHRARDAALETRFAGCRAVGTVVTPDGLDNQEQGARLVLCDGVVGGWAAAWPGLRHYY